MPTTVDIWNRALARIGETRLTLEAAKTITGMTNADPPVFTSNSHGYSDGDLILIDKIHGSGTDPMIECNEQVFEISSAAANTYELLGQNSTDWRKYDSAGGKSYKLSTGKAVRACRSVWDWVLDEVLSAHPWNELVTHSYLARVSGSGSAISLQKAVTLMTNADPPVLTAASHGYSTADVVYLYAMEGAAPLNEGYYVITVIDANSFSLDDQDSTYMTAPGDSKVDKVIEPHTPQGGYAASYPLPADCLRVLGLSDVDDKWTREGDFLHTDATHSEYRVAYTFIKRKTVISSYGPMLQAVLVARLAAEIAEDLTQSASKGDVLMKKYMRMLRQAQGVDAQEQSSMPLQEDDWIKARA